MQTKQLAQGLVCVAHMRLSVHVICTLSELRQVILFGP